MAQINGKTLEFDPLNFPGCSHCGSKVLLYTPSGRMYHGPELGCCLARTLHQISALALRLNDPDMRGPDRRPYEQDMQDNLAAAERHLRLAPDRNAALQNARLKLPGLAAYQFQTVQALLRGGVNR